jgi:hypothetical protein
MFEKLLISIFSDLLFIDFKAVTLDKPIIAMNNTHKPEDIN